MGAECRRIHKPGDALRGLLFALPVKEQNGRQAEHLQVFQQSHILGAVLRHVYLQQNGLFQGLLYFGRAKGVFFELFAGDAPVGVQVEHNRFTLCLRQRLVELRDVTDPRKGQR